MFNIRNLNAVLILESEYGAQLACTWEERPQVPPGVEKLGDCRKRSLRIKAPNTQHEKCSQNRTVRMVEGLIPLPFDFKTTFLNTMPISEWIKEICLQQNHLQILLKPRSPSPTADHVWQGCTLKNVITILCWYVIIISFFGVRTFQIYFTLLTTFRYVWYHFNCNQNAAH